MTEKTVDVVLTTEEVAIDALARVTEYRNMNKALLKLVSHLEMDLKDAKRSYQAQRDTVKRLQAEMADQDLIIEDLTQAVAKADKAAEELAGQFHDYRLNSQQEIARLSETIRELDIRGRKV